MNKLNAESLYEVTNPARRGQTRTPRGAGFTLIELLVVVLIIGILAAVALPQYQTAVDKTQFARMIEMVTPIKRAAEIGYLEKGILPNWEHLTVRLPADCRLSYGPQGTYTCGDVSIDLYENSTPLIRSWHKKMGEIQYFVWLNFSEHPNRRECIATSARGKRLCKSLGGTEHQAGRFLLP